MVAHGAPLKSLWATKGEPSHDAERQAALGPHVARKVALPPATQEECRARAPGGPQHPRRAPQARPHGDRQGRKQHKRYWEKFLQANTCAMVQ